MLIAVENQAGWAIWKGAADMKLVYAIVRNEDGNLVTEELTSHKYSVTKLATTGGFLRKGNTTLMIGTEEDKVDEVIEIIKRECGQRKQIVYNTPYPPTSGIGSNIYTCAPIPIPVDVGGATIFVVDVERYERV